MELDKVIGVALLGHHKAGQEWLYFLAASQLHSYLATSCLRVREVGKPNLWDNTEPVWQYVVDGGSLTVTPSVRIIQSGEVFHNTYSWAVPFQRWDGQGEAREVFEAINRDLRIETRRKWLGQT